MNRANRSFSRRMSRRILIVLSLTIASVALLVITVAGLVLRKMSIGYFLCELQVANEWIEKRLNSVEVASANTVGELSSHLDTPEHVFDALKGTLEPNDRYLLGFGAAFEPYYFPGQGKWFEAYVYRQDDRTNYSQIGGEQHDYFNKEWYRKSFEAKKDYWSDPYFDDAVTQTPMCSYFRPILDMEGRRVGVFGADLSLDWLYGHMQASLIHYIDQLKSTTAQKAAIESEINIARDIQMSRIPTAFPKRSDIDVYASITPAKTVGGDLYDFFIRDKEFIFCIGDVSGKGVPAALLMMVTKSLFRAYACDGRRPDRIVAQMNRDLCENNESCMFVTLLVGALNLDSGRLDYCNAGHEAPVLIGTDVRMLPVNPIPPVGAVEETCYQMQTVDLKPHSTLLFYTDGLSEATNAEDACFGRQRILDVAALAAKAQQTAPKALIEQMTGAVHDFVGDTEQSDDLTMLCLKIS